MDEQVDVEYWTDGGTTFAEAGDTVYFANQFFKITEHPANQQWYYIYPPLHGNIFWYISKPIIVNPDTPQNRLMIQLKYGHS